MEWPCPSSSAQDERLEAAGSVGWPLEAGRDPCCELDAVEGPRAPADRGQPPWPPCWPTQLFSEPRVPAGRASACSGGSPPCIPPCLGGLWVMHCTPWALTPTPYLLTSLESPLYSGGPRPDTLLPGVHQDWGTPSGRLAPGLTGELLGDGGGRPRTPSHLAPDPELQLQRRHPRAEGRVRESPRLAAGLVLALLGPQFH